MKCGFQSTVSSNLTLTKTLILIVCIAGGIDLMAIHTKFVLFIVLFTILPFFNKTSNRMLCQIH